MLPTPIESLDALDRIPRLVRAARDLAGLSTVGALAEAINEPGLGEKTLRLIEQGRRQAHLRELRSIAKACNVGFTFFFRSLSDVDSSAQRLRRLRELTGMTHQELADNVSAWLAEMATEDDRLRIVFAPAIEAWESPDQEDPDEREWQALYDIFGVSMIHLRPRDGDIGLIQLTVEAAELRDEKVMLKDSLDRLRRDRDRNQAIAEAALDVARSATSGIELRDYELALEKLERAEEVRDLMLDRVERLQAADGGADLADELDIARTELAHYEQLVALYAAAPELKLRSPDPRRDAVRQLAQRRSELEEARQALRRLRRANVDDDQVAAAEADLDEARRRAREAEESMLALGDDASA